jgi:quinoprotein glucose dehydrogenase
MRVLLLTSICLMSVCQFAAAETLGGTGGNWAFYGGDAGGSRYSQLDQINTGNVAELRPVWEIHTGDVSDGSDGRPKSEFEATPIVVAGTMFLTTPFNRVLALNPETGKQKWAFDPRIDLHQHYSEGLMNRGVAFWSDPNGVDSGQCHQRVFLATIDARLFALDASSGHPCEELGVAGQIDLTEGISNIKRRGEYEETSAPAVIGDLVIVGSSIADNDRVNPFGGECRLAQRLTWSRTRPT